MQNGVVEFARDLQGPERRALRGHARDIRRRIVLRCLDRNRRDALIAIDLDTDKAIANAGAGEFALQRLERDPLPSACTLGAGSEFPGTVGDFRFELGVGNDLVHQPPLHGALALDALLDSAEEISVVAAHLALVDDARQTAGAGQHREQRHFGQCNGGRAVVRHDDVIGSERQFIAAAGGGAVDHADEALAGILAGIFEPVAGLVGEFAEVHFMRVGRSGEHADIGAGAEHAVLAGAQQHHLHIGMLEAQPLYGIRQFDVDAEVIGIQLEQIALEQAAVLVHIHGQGGDIARHVEFPVPVLRRLGLEIDEGRAVGEFPVRFVFLGHKPPSGS